MMETSKVENIPDNKIVSVSFKIIDIKLIKFSFESSVDKEQIGNEDFTFEINFRYDTNVEKQTLNTFVLTKIFADQDKKLYLGQIETKMEFLLVNFDELVVIENDQVRILTMALNIFISVSISTARGMIASKTSGTSLEKAYLPVINSQDVLNTLIPKKTD